MLLYTCAMKRHGASTPVIKHPCGLAARALDRAGYDYDIEVVKGFKNIPFSTPTGSRDHIVELTGQPYVPVLVLDDGSCIAGEHEIMAWAQSHPAA